MKALVAGAGALAAALFLTACPESSPRPPVDAGPDLPALDAATPDVPITAQLLDFTVGGCPAFDGGVPQCRGPAPLTVSFAPVTTGTATRFLWDFGDGTMASEAFPTHTYTLPDTYTVALVAADLSSQSKKAFIEVTTNPLGGACDVDPQCETGTTCLCGQAAQCAAAFFRGLCSLKCDGALCPPGAVCANLGFGLAPLPPPMVRPAWRGLHCLRACTKDDDCASGQRCRSLPVSGPPARWERGCFFSFPGDIGASCRAPDGSPQHDLCLGGQCADLGAQGLCSADCGTVPCPIGSACAQLNDGRKICLKRCDASAPCGDDPLIACSVGGSPGPLGFKLAPEEGTAATFCGAKPCTTNAECAPAGVCMGAPTGHCVRPAVKP